MSSEADARLYPDGEFCIVEVEPLEETDDYIRGPILLTGLANHAMPLIRYRIGDIGTLLKNPESPIRCGQVFSRIDGRIEDEIRTPDGRTFGRLDHIFKGIDGVREAQLRQTQSSQLDVLVVVGDDWTPASLKKLTASIRERLGSGLAVSVTCVDRIPLGPGGKQRFVVSEAPASPADIHEPEDDTGLADYLDAPMEAKVRKVFRYVRLYGPSRTVAKIRGRYHLKKHFDGPPALEKGPSPGKHVGLIGCGSFAFSSLAYYLRRDFGDVMRTAMDLNPDRAASLAQAYRCVHCTTDANDIFEDPNIDLVFVASTHSTHADYAIEALRRNKNVHVEKPHVVNRDQLVRLCSAVRDSTAGIGLGFNRPKSNLGRRTIESLRAARGPKAVHWSIVGHHLGKGHWYARPEEGGRIFGNLCHWTDFIYLCVPEEARYPITLRSHTGSERDSDIVVSLHFGDGSLCSITFTAKGYSLEGVRERLTAQSGDTLIMLDDFNRLRIETAGQVENHRPLFRDHGHRQCVAASYGLTRKLTEERGHLVKYLWETGELFLRAKESLDLAEEVTVEPFSEAFLRQTS